MAEENCSRQFLIRDLLVLSVSVAIFMAVATRNYAAVEQDRQANGIPFTALRNFTYVWLILGISAIGAASGCKGTGSYPVLLVFVWASFILSLLNFLAPLGAL